jgi:hypothetical protein
VEMGYPGPRNTTSYPVACCRTEIARDTNLPWSDRLNMTTTSANWLSLGFVCGLGFHCFYSPRRIALFADKAVNHSTQVAAND